jgi:hypothetical protein
MAKNVTNSEEVEDLPLPEETAAEPPAELAEAGPAPAAPGAKRALGVKEPIVFKWKVVGTSQGTVVTLYKSVEKEESEAQVERLRKEDYYHDVRLLEASAKVEQPAKPAKKSGRPEPAGKIVSAASKPAEAARKASRPGAAKKPVKAKPTAKPSKAIKKKTVSSSSSKRVSKAR